jgi:hypothetical protein
VLRGRHSFATSGIARILSASLPPPPSSPPRRAAPPLHISQQTPASPLTLFVARHRRGSFEGAGLLETFSFVKLEFAFSPTRRRRPAPASPGALPRRPASPSPTRQWIKGSRIHRLRVSPGCCAARRSDRSESSDPNDTRLFRPRVHLLCFHPPPLLPAPREEIRAGSTCCSGKCSVEREE